ncbi:flagellar hook basal-body protein [Methylobacterium sp. JK268]
MGLFDAMSNSVTGLNAQSSALNTISGNIANASTPGFKGVDTRFADLLTEAPSGGAAGGVAPRATLTTAIQGTIATTGVPTNLAITGDGSFIVKQNTGTTASPSFTGEALYTRRGDFTVGANGYLVNGAGDYLVGAGGSGTGDATSTPLMLAGADGLSDLSVSSGGTLTGTFADGSSRVVGRITLAHFASSDGLQGLDGGTYAATDQSGPPTYGIGTATLTSGAVEQSDTNLSDQFAKMIVTQQAYSANTKVLTATNEMLQDAITMYV